jgi:hypothetical protein
MLQRPYKLRFRVRMVQLSRSPHPNAQLYTTVHILIQKNYIVRMKKVPYFFIYIRNKRNAFHNFQTDWRRKTCYFFMDDLVHLTIKWCYLQIQTRSDPL